MANEEKVIVTKSKLDALATSISTKSGQSLPMTIAQMKSAVDGISGGSILITDVANSTGITCVITTNAEPTPSENIPLNTQLIDFTAITTGYVIGSNGDPYGNEYSYCSDFTKIDPSMTFTFKAYQWWNLGFYDSSKTFISGGSQDNFKDSADNEIVTGTLSSTNIPSNAAYIRLSGYPYTIADTTTMSLIRTA